MDETWMSWSLCVALDGCIVCEVGRIPVVGVGSEYSVELDL
jgi:hypothetical protein